jgi:hypothetical protein
LLGSVLTYSRRHVVGLTAVVLALGGSAYAVANPSSSPSIRVCVQPGTGALRAAGSGGHCRSGERSFVVNAKGVRGPRGSRGPTGPRGLNGPIGVQGQKGDKGDQGTAGHVGPSQYAEFFALMPADNAATVAVGSAVQFPQSGPQQGGILVKNGSSNSAFVLPSVGTYRVAFSVPVSEAGQLELMLDSGGGAVALPSTVYGRSTGTSQIAGEALVTTTAANSAISVVNESSTALTITPLAGGTHPAAASLVIEQLS